MKKILFFIIACWVCNSELHAQLFISDTLALDSGAILYSDSTIILGGNSYVSDKGSLESGTGIQSNGRTILTQRFGSIMVPISSGGTGSLFILGSDSNKINIYHLTGSTVTFEIGITDSVYNNPQILDYPISSHLVNKTWYIRPVNQIASHTFLSFYWRSLDITSGFTTSNNCKTGYWKSGVTPVPFWSFLSTSNAAPVISVPPFSLRGDSAGTLINQTKYYFGIGDSLSAFSPITIINQPSGVGVCPGAPASFNVSVIGGGGSSGLTYQWRKNGSNIGTASTPVPINYSNSYSIPSPVASDSGNYSVVITAPNSGTPATSSNAFLLVKTVTGIITQPTDIDAPLGVAVSFNPVIAGTNLSYQWYKNGTLISGTPGTGPNYSFTSVASTDSGNYNVTASGACGALVSSNPGHLSLLWKWTGNNGTSWKDPTNWAYSPANPPSGNNNSRIPTGVLNLPIIDSIATVNNLELQLGTKLILSGSNSSLTIRGIVSGTGVIKSVNGNALTFNNPIPSVTNSGTVHIDQSVPHVTNRIQNLMVNYGNIISSGNITLGDTLEITNTVSLINGTLNTGNILALISDSNGTARVSSIPSTADISGNVKVQRYIPPVIRQYRMLSPNVSSYTFSDLIDNIFVTGTGGSTNGFDPTTTNSSSVYTYQESTAGGGRGWHAIPAISTSLVAGKGSLDFVCGDRTLASPAWYTSPYVPQNAVTVDFKGAINKGTISPAITYTNTSSIISDGWNVVGNPYPSQIDWSAVSKTNLDGNYWMFDPQTGSYYGSNSGIIASGQAFFVHAISSSPAVSFTENSKSSLTVSKNYFKTSYPTLTGKMFLDSFNSDFMNIVYASGSSKNFNAQEDITKLYNSVINFGVQTDSNVDVQNSVAPPFTGASDTFRLFASASTGTYHLNFSGQSTINSIYNIFLKDSFTSTVQDIRLNPNYNFAITTNPASSGYNRFKIIFVNSTILNVNLLNFSASKSGSKDVRLDWMTASEKNADKFVVERSMGSANIFVGIGEVKAKSNSGSLLQYNLNDAGALATEKDLYYRLKIIDKSGNFYYSDVAEISGRASQGFNEISLFPNPAFDFVSVKFPPSLTGNFKIRIYDIEGKILFESSVLALRASSNVFDVRDLRSGIYFAKIIDSETNHTSVVKFTKF